MSVIKRLSLYEFTLWGRDLLPVVRIRESLYYRGFFFFVNIFTAAGLAWLVERLSAEREVAGSIPEAGLILRVLK